MTVLRSLCLSLSSLSASVSLSLLISASFFPFLPLFFLLCDTLAITSTARCHYLSPPCFIVCFFFPLLHLLLLLVTSLAVVLRHSTNFNIPHIDFLTTPLPFAAPLSLSLSSSLRLSSLTPILLLVFLWWPAARQMRPALPAVGIMTMKERGLRWKSFLLKKRGHSNPHYRRIEEEEERKNTKKAHQNY